MTQERQVYVYLNCSQTDGPPPARYVGVRISKDHEGAVVSSHLARELAAVIERQNPDLAARLRKVSDEARSLVGPRNDPGDEVEEVDDNSDETALAYRILGRDPPAPR
jgi:hypothetical protein